MRTRGPQDLEADGVNLVRKETLCHTIQELESVEDRIGIIQLNRPEALNALSDQLLSELGEALKAFLKDDQVRCIIITGGAKRLSAQAQT